MEQAEFAASGAIRYEAVFSKDEMAALGQRVDAVLSGRPGRRLTGGDWTAVLPRLTAIAAGLIGDAAFPVRAIVFDKTRQINWAVGWHQDRTVAVRYRADTPGFGPWSTKDGVVHVAPPVEVLSAMVTLRLHIDDCVSDNAPLKIAEGTHLLGVVAADVAANVAASHPQRVCLAAAGDVWACSTLILHASDRSRIPDHRRVLHIDYAAHPLPGGLEWMGLAEDETALK